jgi:hypothetical protein
MKIIYNSACCVQQTTTNAKQHKHQRLISSIVTKPKNDTFYHEYEHEDLYIKTNIKHEHNRIVIKHSYRWFDENNKQYTKTDLQIFKKLKK